MLFTTKWLADFFTNFRGNINASEILEVNTDSRKEMSQSLFIPLVGEKFDGHEFVLQAIENGAVALVWEEKRVIPSPVPDDFPIFLVNDTLTALQQLSAHYRNEVNPIVVGITGSNGKTTTKDLTASVVQSTYKTHYTKGNFNNHIGLPLTILSMPKETEVLILEMGMSNFGEIELLSKLARPDYAIITNIGESHIEFLGSREGIAKAKMEIVSGLKENGEVIIDGDEPLLAVLHDKENTKTSGFKEHNDDVIDHIHITTKGTTFRMDNEDYQIPLFGKHHAKNASFAIGLGKQLGITNERMKEAVHHLEQTGMRFELMEGAGGLTIINDAYNASATSMKASIEVVKQITGFKEKVLVLGDILELGEYSKSMHRSVADMIDDEITAVFTYGKDAEVISSAVKEGEKDILSSHFTSKERLLEKLKHYQQEHTLMLFKASRGLKFETLIHKLIN